MAFFWMIFLTLMLPVEVRILPTFEVVASLGMLNSYWGLSIPLIASATATFMFRQTFLTIPDELLESARIDGAKPLQFFLGHPHPYVTHQYCSLVRNFIYLWLEPIFVAVAHYHQYRHVDHRNVDKANAGIGRASPAMEYNYDDSIIGNVATHCCGYWYAKALRTGPHRNR